MPRELKDTVAALDRGLALLHCFSETQRVLSSTELAHLTGIPRPSVIRLAATLVAHRWLQTEPGGGRYMLGPGAVTLARAFLAGLDVRTVARGPMQQLADRYGASVYLALRDGLELIIVEVCRARSAMLAARLDVGSRVPLPNSALGRAYLGAVDAATRAHLIESLRLARGTDWVALESGLDAALAERERHGWCLSLGDFHRDINSIAVAMVGPRGEVYALTCGGPAFAVTEARLRDVMGPALRELTREVAAAIGGRACVPDATADLVGTGDASIGAAA
jgi:DNA-binding IclR family transcriptional regulator